MTMEPILEYLKDLTNRGDHKAKELLDLAIRQEEKEKFIVVAHHRINKGHTLEYSDSWTAHDCYEESYEVYEKHLKDDGVYTTSICNVITSTDY